MGSAVLAVSFPNVFPTPGLLAFGYQEEREKTFTLCKYCSSVAKRLMCYQHSFSHKFRTQLHTGQNEKVHFTTSSKPDTVTGSNSFLIQSSFIFFTQIKHFFLKASYFLFSPVIEKICLRMELHKHANKIIRTYPQFNL